MKAAQLKDEEKYDLAQRMVKFGFGRRIITSSTNVSDRLVDRLKKEFGKDDPGAIGRFKLSETFLQTISKKIEATNYMSIYLRKAKDPVNNDDIEEVVDAYEVYREINKKLRPGVDVSTMLLANEAWTLARDFRADEIKMMECNRCNRYFITAYDSNKSQKKHSCPYCDSGS